MRGFAAAIGVLAAALVALAPAARADATLPGGATITFGQLLVHEAGAAQLAPPSSDDAAHQYFNLAHCACGQPNAAPASFLETTFAYQLLLHAGSAAVHRPLEVWTGLGCDDPATRAAQCHQIASATIDDLSTIPASGATPEVGVYDVMATGSGERLCKGVGSAAQWAIADGDGDGVDDYFVSQPVVVDAQPPPLPTAFAARGGAGSIELTWTPPTDASDVAGYQVLCANLDGSPASLRPALAPRYTTARQLCGESLDVPLVPSAVDTDAAPDAADVQLPQTIGQLDPSIVCGEVADPAASSVRITGLPDHTPMLLVLVAYDAARNPAATYLYPALTTSPPPAGCACDAGAPLPGGTATLAGLVALALGRRRRGQAFGSTAVRLSRPAGTQ
jgi:hypothetical protein